MERSGDVDGQVTVLRSMTIFNAMLMRRRSLAAGWLYEDAAQLVDFNLRRLTSLSAWTTSASALSRSVRQHAPGRGASTCPMLTTCGPGVLLEALSVCVRASPLSLLFAPPELCDVILGALREGW